jgi:hypothetical protein
LKTDYDYPGQYKSFPGTACAIFASVTEIQLGVVMRFITLAVIALLSGIGAGLIGFYLMWQSLGALTGSDPGIGHDSWLVASIFGPGVLVSFCVFHFLRQAIRPHVAVT